MITLSSNLSVVGKQVIDWGSPGELTDAESRALGWKLPYRDNLEHLVDRAVFHSNITRYWSKGELSAAMRMDFLLIQDTIWKIGLTEETLGIWKGNSQYNKLKNVIYRNISFHKKLYLHSMCIKSLCFRVQTHSNIHSNFVMPHKNLYYVKCVKCVLQQHLNSMAKFSTNYNDSQKAPCKIKSTRQEAP